MGKTVLLAEAADRARSAATPYLSTAAKHGIGMLGALTSAAAGTPSIPGTARRA